MAKLGLKLGKLITKKSSSVSRKDKGERRKVMTSSLVDPRQTWWYNWTPRTAYHWGSGLEILS